MLYIGYKLEDSSEKEITKLVICKDGAEYRRMKTMIEEAGYEVIEFAQVFKASTVLGK